jgi:hypothetical protein
MEFFCLWTASKEVMESKENLRKISKVPEYFLCNTKKTIAKYKN